MAEATADEDTAPAAAAPAPKGSNKLLITVLLALIIAGGGGAGVYFFMNHQAAAAEEQSADDTADTAGEGAKASKVKGKKNKKDKKTKEVKVKLPAVFVPFDPPFVANFESNGEIRFLQVQLEVMTRDPLVAEQIKLETPMIRNDLLLLFGSVEESKISTRAGKEQLREDALANIRRIIDAEGGGGAKIEAVYFTSFVMQ